MSLHESQYGDAKRQPENSALSGKPLDFSAGDVSFKVNGYRVGVKAAEWRTASAEQKAAAKAEWAAALPSAPAPQSTFVEPAYDNMSLAELKQAAEDKQVDITGRSNKPGIIQALRYADLQGQAIEPATIIGQSLDQAKGD